MLSEAGTPNMTKMPLIFSFTVGDQDRAALLREWCVDNVMYTWQKRGLFTNVNFRFEHEGTVYSHDFYLFGYSAFEVYINFNDSNMPIVASRTVLFDGLADDKDVNRYVLVRLLLTLCDKPELKVIIYDTYLGDDITQAFSIVGFQCFKKRFRCDFFKTYDFEKLDQLYFRYLICKLLPIYIHVHFHSDLSIFATVSNRLYDPARGLYRSAKNPQQSNAKYKVHELVKDGDDIIHAHWEARPTVSQNIFASQLPLHPDSKISRTESATSFPRSQRLMAQQRKSDTLKELKEIEEAANRAKCEKEAADQAAEIKEAANRAKFRKEAADQAKLLKDEAKIRIESEKKRKLAERETLQKEAFNRRETNRQRNEQQKIDAEAKREEKKRKHEDERIVAALALKRKLEEQAAAAHKRKFAEEEVELRKLEQEAAALKLKNEQQAAEAAALKLKNEQQAAEAVAEAAALKLKIEQQAAEAVAEAVAEAAALKLKIEQQAAEAAALKLEIEQRAAEAVALKLEIKQQAAEAIRRQDTSRRLEVQTTDIEASKSYKEAELKRLDAEIEEAKLRISTLRNLEEGQKKEEKLWYHKDMLPNQKVILFQLHMMPNFLT